MIDSNKQKQYIGDGVYVRNDGWYVWLETERANGLNEIGLEPDMVLGLLQYIARVGFIDIHTLIGQLKIVKDRLSSGGAEL